MRLKKDHFRKESSYPAKVKLSKRVVAGVVVYFYNNPAFPDYIYIALDDCSVCGRGDVVNLLDEGEKSLEFIPLARIDELVLNIPAQEDFYGYFREQYKIEPGEKATGEMQKEFWDNFEWEFATEVRKIKIEWDR